MALAAGTRLGSYEIAGTLGVGGMGEVYRATDTTLERDVAIKVLPDSVASDANRVARFEQEAKTLAALNHPNIAQIHGLEKTDGTTALVMELVEGPTLAERIAEGPIPPDEALGVAMQIADALEAAHGRQIVHRDLKPANIKLRPDGTVKVLDFGIAKALETQRGASGPQTPSLTTPAMTQAGILLGTAAYMSPEQARGKAVDERADIWAFGCVLYEMLTGQPAFGGEDVPTTLARVLANDADLASLPGAITPAVRQTIELCLQKDIKERPSDIHDVKLALKGAFDTGHRSAADNAMAAQPFWKRALPFSAALVVVAMLAGGLTWSLMRPSAPIPATISRFVLTPPATAPLADLTAYDVAVSPDGKRLAYVAQDPQKPGLVELYVRDLDGLDARAIQDTEVPSTDGTMNPFFSPDGQWIGFRSPGRGLMRVSLNGAPSLKILDDPSPYFLGASWAADGTLIYSSGLNLHRASVGGGGTPEPLTSASTGTFQALPTLLPGGGAVLFSLIDSQTERVAVLNLRTGEQKVLLENATQASYAPTGHLVFVRGTTLMAAAFDLDRLAVTGEPVALLQGIRHPGPQTAADYVLSATGTLVYVLEAPENKTAIVWVDREGREEPLGIDPCACFDPTVSPDGTHVAFTVAAPGASTNIWVWSALQHTFTPLTFETRAQRPVWTPDGARIVYGAPDGLYSRRADGAGAAEQLLMGANIDPWSWAPSGELIFNDSATGSLDINALTVAGDHKRRVVLATKFNEGRPVVSPDGHWLAYESNEQGREDIYVRPFPDVEGGKWQVSSDGGEEPKWSRDGRTLFFLGPKSLMATTVETEPTFTFRTPEAVLDRGKYFFSASVARRFDVSPDGRRFLLLKPAARGSAAAPQIIVVTNWFEELKRLVPTK